MPSVSKAQQRLMGAAEHGATFPLARKVRASMTHQQLHDFASGSMKGKPGHVKAGKPKSVAERLRMKHGVHPGQNLGTYLHPRKG